MPRGVYKRTKKHRDAMKRAHRARSLNRATKPARKAGKKGSHSVEPGGRPPRVTAAVIAPPPSAPAAGGERFLPTDSAARKRIPMATGLLDYFPDALAAVANVSWLGNEKHNPGEPLHHARGKSMDHGDCAMRHLSERGGFDTVVIKGVEYRIRHSAALVWRALALLQEELEHDLSLPLPRGARMEG